MKLLLYFIVALGIAAAIITLKYFSPTVDISLLAASAIVMVIFIAAFSYIEVKRRYEHFAI